MKKILYGFIFLCLNSAIATSIDEFFKNYSDDVAGAYTISKEEIAEGMKEGGILVKKKEMVMAVRLNDNYQIGGTYVTYYLNAGDSQQNVNNLYAAVSFLGALNAGGTNNKFVEPIPDLIILSGKLDMEFSFVINKIRFYVHYDNKTGVIVLKSEFV